MILQALYQLSQDEELLPDPDFEMKPIAWLIRIDNDGKLLGIEGTHYISSTESKKKKPQEKPKPFKIPRQSPSRSGKKPPAEFFVDNALYVFGIDIDGKKKKEDAELRAKSFREKIQECWEATKDEGVEAVLKFLDDIYKGKQNVVLEKCKANDLFAFIIYSHGVNQFVTDRDAIRNYWKRKRMPDSSGNKKEERCLVTGVKCDPVDKHPMIKKIPGGTGSGVAIVSFNSTAFESYGFDGNDNAPVSREAAEACATALNRLIDSAYPNPTDSDAVLSKRNFRLNADTTVCFWASSPKSKDFLDSFSSIIEANPETVKELYRSVWSGKIPQIDDPSDFYALTISGAQGRATVRDWIETTVEKVNRNLALHFYDLDIVRNTPKPKKGDLPPHFPKSLLMESLASQGKNDQIPSSMAADFIHSALHGTPYPFSILQRAIQRVRAEISKTEWIDFARQDARAALIKAVLNRRKRFYPESRYKEVTKEMDKDNKESGYLLGRLMAVIERLQQTAMGDVNAGVVDRYFSAASAAPRSVFIRLMKNARNHARKSKDDEKSAKTAHWLERELDEIAFHFDPKDKGFPPSLSLEQQGLFILGFHHQRRYLWMNKEDRKVLESGHGENNG